MKAIIKGRWWVVLSWVLLIAGLFYMSPNMADLVREKGNIEVPNGYSSKLASQLQEKTGGEHSSQVALVFYNEKKLTEGDIKEAKKAVDLLEQNKESLGITEIATHFKDSQLKDTMVSKDGKAILVSLNVQKGDKKASVLSQDLSKALDGIKVQHQFTSDWMITDQLMKSSEEGVKKTEGITVVFILIVLILVFRSAVAPVIPLLTVGFSYLASQSIVSILIDRFDFPISNNTQMFLVAILFGIGTDYCILLLSRFKEELSDNRSVTTAILETYKSAGRTVFFSGIAVMVGFASIGFSEFNLYQSASAVAVGVAVLLLALFTLVPFFMAVLGKKIYWPSKKKLDHRESKLWGAAGRFSLSKPILSLLVVGIICVPFIFAYEGRLTFNSLEEISQDAPPVKAFHMIEKSFGAGESMPTKVVLKNDERMDSNEYLYLTERISREIEKVNLVQSVRSVTRPIGKPLEEFLIAKQSEKLEEGVGKGKEGVSKVSDELHKTSEELSKQEPQIKRGVSGINDLVSGTSRVQSGLSKLQSGLAQVDNGIRQVGIAGSTEVKKGLQEAKSGVQDLLRVYQELYQTYKGISQEIESSELRSKMENTNTRLAGAITEQKRIVTGLDELIKGVDEQIAGSKKLADGQGVIVKQTPQLINGLSSINDGQKRLLKEYQALTGQLGKLSSGLAEGAKGLDKISGGLGDAQNYLTGLTGSPGVDGFYIPGDVLENKDFQKVLDAYLSPDRKTMTLDVVFKTNPYARETMNQIDDIKDAIQRATKGTKLENATVAVGGITSASADLNTMSNQDYARTVTLMLMGIGIILVFVFRSIIMPAYILGSLLLTYYTTMGMNEVLFIDILGYSGISWVVPFFSFVILMALGVDYSIFLMDRFNEYQDVTVADAMLLSMKKMGTVIISAVIILGGTFAAMIPSGMLSLIQIASIILIGLLLYTFVVLPFLIPVLVKNFGKANWWPFRR
ncbi:putative drug exporter of the RND superfamily [Thermoactinomyces sp. DSM 45891]|uniref:MMPL family transporter n=1 Tax=Thermoactinomyces sp. DSM 45891 TaxID=1761907 RepID=UPI0009188FA9|nr:MMPL family transporter [Thermoactinomyces sp. DSM 45891]SFX21312.1 putative drug exporter of the RND superfamily [Thermoactinomyces sp. DSM 45891]